MNKYIYPSIAGTDHEALVHYFSLLDSCPLEPQDTGSVPPITHVKLLRKIKTVASGEGGFHVQTLGTHACFISNSSCFIDLVLRNSCMKCYVVLLKKVVKGSK